MPSHIDIIRLTELRRPAADVRAEIDAIFFEYLRLEPHLAFVGCAAGRAVGYVVSCHANPARSPRFAGLTYFQAFAAACARFPAHLHINLTEAARGGGIGARLIEACAADAAAAGLSGIHVVTSATARNVGFYRRNGFHEVDSAERNGNRVVFLGREL
jgi:GNAT superfamily N-acetyltransferase